MCAETTGLETTASTVLEDSVELRSRAGDADMPCSCGVCASSSPASPTDRPWREEADDKGGVGYEGDMEDEGGCGEVVSPRSCGSSGGPWLLAIEDGLGELGAVGGGAPMEAAAGGWEDSMLRLEACRSRGVTLWERLEGRMGRVDDVKGERRESQTWAKYAWAKPG